MLPQKVNACNYKKRSVEELYESMPKPRILQLHQALSNPCTCTFLFLCFRLFETFSYFFLFPFAISKTRNKPKDLVFESIPHQSVSFKYINVMSLGFSQVLGHSSDHNDFVDATSNPSDMINNNNNNHSNNNNGQSNTDLKIPRTDLQIKRASRKSNIQRNYVGSFPFFNSMQSTLPRKGDEVIDLLHLPLSTSSPINLAHDCIKAQIDKDNSVPTLYEILTKYMIDNYNFKPKQKLNPFNRFEKAEFFGIPEKLLDNNSESMVTNIGMFLEIKRAWLTVDNKLYIWNYNASLTDQEFDIIDDFNGTILNCILVKPKKDIFIESVNYLIIVATSKEIKILALEYNADTRKLEVSDTKMAVSVHGLIVNKFVFFEKTNDIFFTGAGSADSIWKLNYSNSKDWFTKSCSKECLNNSSFVSVLPNIPVLDWINGDYNSSVESIIDLKIDQSRNIIYTLSSKSILRAYKLQIHKHEITLGNPIIKKVSNILKELSTTVTNIRAPLLKSGLKLVSIHPVGKNENPNLFLVAVASNGCRFFINGSTLYGDRLMLTTHFVKFPPIDIELSEILEKKKEKMASSNQNLSNDDLLNNKYFNNQSTMQSLRPQYNTYNKQGSMLPNTMSYDRTGKLDNDKSITKSYSPALITPEQLKQAQEKSKLLEHTLNSLIISPGIFIGYSKETGLYSSTPDYGIFNKSSQYIEDFELIEKFSNVYDIIQITKSFNPVDQPKGYANEFASQYTAEPLEFAVLTDRGIVVYRYRTPDLILEDSLNEHTFNEFASKYGFDEACSTSLYLACKYDKSDSFRNLASKFFISGGKNSKLDSSLTPIIDNVEPSDRFRAVLILFSRLIRQFWNQEVFKLRPEIKFDKMGFVDLKSIKSLETDKNIILEGLNINKTELEYLLCSVLIIIKFFEDNKKIIPGLSRDHNSKSENTSWKEKAVEVCIQAEEICFDSISKFLNITKEGLSFLAVLLEEETTSEKSNFKNIISFLPVHSQVDLSCVTFSDFLQKSDNNVTQLVKDLLSCIINKSITDGNSVELVANTLQEKCGYFCSTDDVLIFKAVESLKKAKEYAENKDATLKIRYLQNSITLLKQSSDSLSDETITDCISVILQLDYFSGAIEFLLDIANTPELVKLATQYENELHLSMAIDPIKRKSYERKLKLYHLVFQILMDIDKKALTSFEEASNTTIIGNSSNNINNSKANAPAFVDKDGQLITYYSQTRDECYKICLNYKDKAFHFEFYKWFIANGIDEKLLYIDTPYILEFLKQNSSKDLEMSKLLWIYYSRKGDYYEAANHLYGLALSKFDIKLIDRIQFLSIANSFIKGIESQFIKQDILNLASRISDLISVSNLQDELLATIKQDPRINETAEMIANRELGNEILPINILYNDYIDPLGYYELALMSFKLSDYRNFEDIMSKWESLVNKWYLEYKKKPNHESEPFYYDIINKFKIVANRIKDVDNLFPIIPLFTLIFKNIYGNKKYNQNIAEGSVVDCFTKSGISYNKLYYSLRKLIESTTYELFDGYSKSLNTEMKYLINEWFKSDKRLRDVISSDDIQKMVIYNLDDDPIYSYIKGTGNPL